MNIQVPRPDEVSREWQSEAFQPGHIYLDREAAQHNVFDQPYLYFSDIVADHGRYAGLVSLKNGEIFIPEHDIDRQNWIDVTESFALLHKDLL